MKTSLRAAAAAPFAHLFGRSVAAKAAAEPEEDPKAQREGESDEDYAKRMEEEEEGAPAAEGGNEEDGTGGAAAARGGRRPAAVRGREAALAEARLAGFAAGRTFERRRCAAIFGACADLASAPMAAHFAFKTNMTAPEAIGALASATELAPTSAAAPAAPAQAGKPRGLAAAMAEQASRVPNPGSSSPDAPAAGSTEAVSAAIVAAGRKRRGEA